MQTDTAIEILKNALLLERRGKAFYGQVANQAADPAVREFFQRMAEEEEEHVRVLSEQYRAYQSRGGFLPAGPGVSSTAPAPGADAAVLGERLARAIAAASYEAAAVAAAMSLERNAIRLYGERAQAATDPEERALYRWLADWEAEHLEFLSRVDRQVTEAAWNDNRFWPL